MRKSMGFVFLLALVLLTAGCIGGTTQIVNDQSKDGFFELSVEWSAFESQISAARLNVPSDQLSELFTPTHVSARLVYPEDNKVYVEMTEKEAAENSGFISMEVPPGKAVLQVVVVHHQESSYGGHPFCQVLYGAVKENISIRGNELTRLRLEDLDLKPFEVNWSQEWQDKFDENNVAHVSKEDVIPGGVNGSYITPTIEYAYPIHSDLIPPNLKLRKSGVGEYKWVTQERWHHITYLYDHGYSARIRVAVSDELDGFVVSEGDTRLEYSAEYTGWISPYIVGTDWNLHGSRYYFSGAPAFKVDGEKRPTEFTLIWSD